VLNPLYMMLRRWGARFLGHCDFRHSQSGRDCKILEAVPFRDSSSSAGCRGRRMWHDYLIHVLVLLFAKESPKGRRVPHLPCRIHAAGQTKVSKPLILLFAELTFFFGDTRRDLVCTFESFRERCCPVRFS